MTLDSIGVGGWGGEEGGWVAAEEGLGEQFLSGNRRYSAAMVPCSPWPLLARRGICGNNQLLE